jgi:hypothetical protein
LCEQPDEWWWYHEGDNKRPRPPVEDEGFLLLQEREVSMAIDNSLQDCAGEGEDRGGVA